MTSQDLIAGSIDNGERVRRFTTLTSMFAVAAALAVCPQAAMAQEAATAEEAAIAQEGATDELARLESIIVTARKREESVQSVPASISVFGGEDLAEQRLYNASELQYSTPGFYVQNYEGAATITMRGVGAQIPGGPSSVATHLDGIYQASSSAQLNRLFDVERVEVIRGPQGTLYGRNSTGGALNIITRRAGDDLEGDLSVSYGTFNTLRGDGGVSLPIGDNWGVRLAGSFAEGDGQFLNTFNGEKVGNEKFLGGRVSLAGTVGSVSVDLFVQRSRDEDNATQTLIPLVDADDPTPLLGWNKTFLDQPTEQLFRRDMDMAGLALSGDLGNGFSWRSITGYLDYTLDNLLDVNPRPSGPVRVGIATPTYAEQFSQEAQLLYSGDRLNGVLGAYYLDAEQGDQRVLTLDGVAPFTIVLFDTTSRDDTKAYAVFADLNYDLTDQLTLNGGVRWNREEIRNRFAGTGPLAGGPFDLSGTQGEPTWRIGLDYAVRPQLMFYGSVSTGVQSGFFGSAFDTATGADRPNEVEPETLVAYEVGMKSVLGDNGGYFNVSAFYYDYSDLQVQKGGIIIGPDGAPDLTVPPFFFTTNAAEAEIHGIDLELTNLRIQERLKVDIVAQYLNAEYTDYDTINDFREEVSFAGNRLPRAPKFALSSALTLDGLRLGNSAEGEIRLEYNYRSKTFFTEDNREAATQSGVGLLNLTASVDFNDDRWRLFASGRNLSNERFFDFHRGDVFANAGEFRSFEVGFRYNFR
jgi:iron complex outermembrane recepter protein